MKKLLMLLLSITLMATLSACGGSSGSSQTPAPAPAKTDLILGTSADYPPFEFIYLDDKGDQQYGGIDILLAEKLAEDMGLELQVVNMNFDSLKKGEIDMVIAAIEATPEREAAADFSDPYYTDYPAMILVKEANADQYKTLDDFAGKSVGAQTGTTKADIVTNEMNGANLVALTSVLDLVNELVYDKCDAIVLDGAVALDYADSNADLVVSAVELGEALPFRVAVQKGDPAGLLEGFNATINAAVEDGTVAKWVDEADALSAKAIE